MHVITYRPHVIMANLQPILSGHNYMQLHTRETRDDTVLTSSQGFFEFKICRYFYLHFQSVNFKIEIRIF